MAPFVSRTIGDITAEVLMSNTVFGGGYLLVEGSSDQRFFNSRINQAHCQIVICGTKQMVVTASLSIKIACSSNALGVIDDDFDFAFAITHACSDLVSTDTHDLETLLLSSPALNSILQEYADSSKIHALEHAEGKSFANSFISRALPFGKLRYLNAMHNFNVSFEEHFSPWKFIDHATWILDETKLLNEFSSHSKQSLSQTQAMYASVSGIPPWNYIQGHDAVDVLAIAFKNKIKCNKNVCGDDICSALRLAFHASLFQATSLYTDIRNWETRNSQVILI